jgi:hypothetical protein
MGLIDQKQFTDAVARARAGGHINFVGDPYSVSDAWVAALRACNRLAMFDMLPAIKAISPLGRDDLEFVTAVDANLIGAERIKFACTVVRSREIEDRGLPADQVNDGREFLGCTRLDDPGVRNTIDVALNNARLAVGSGASCCAVNLQAWAGRIRGNPHQYDAASLVGQRRAFPGASMKSNLAAAAHYMLARYHVCAAKAAQWQMNTVIEGYDLQKRNKIASGDRDLSSMALTPGNPPFPPDFAITNWAKKGSVDGEADRLRCNSSASLPVIIPDVNNKEWGFE